MLLFGAPVDQVAGVQGDAEKIGGDESELRGLDANDTNDRAVNRSNYPALPELFANEHSRQDGQNAGDVIESNHVERIQHIVPMSRKRSLMEYSAGEVTSMAPLLKVTHSVARDQRIMPGFLGDATPMTCEQPAPPEERVQLGGQFASSVGTGCSFTDACKSL